MVEHADHNKTVKNQRLAGRSSGRIGSAIWIGIHSRNII